MHPDANRGIHGNPKKPLRARGNLSYLQFVRLVQEYWMRSNPDIPMVPAGDEHKATYPCIYYGLEFRKPYEQEPKPRLRSTDGDVVIMSQRFVNVVGFTVITESQPELASEIIERFEDFMLEFTPVFKELGASELTYLRRFPDSEENRSGAGVVRRKVGYNLVTEKTRAVRHQKIENIIINARIWLEENKSSTYNIGGPYTNISPRYYLAHGQVPSFEVRAEHLNTNTVVIPGTSFFPFDMVYLAPKYGSSMPLTPGYYIILNVMGVAWSDTVEYEIGKFDGESGFVPVAPFEEEGIGSVFYVFDDRVSTRIEDQFLTPPKDED